MDYRTFCKDWADYRQLTGEEDGRLVVQIRLACDTQLKQAIDTLYGDTWRTFTVEQALTEIGHITQRTSNRAVKRKTFTKLTQQDNESVRDFVIRCKQVATECNFACPCCDADLTNWMLTDKITCGVHNETLQHELLQQNDSLASLEAVIRYCETFEAALNDRKLLDTDRTVAAVPVTDDHSDLELAAAGLSAYKQSKRRPQQRHTTSGTVQDTTPCRYCGGVPHTQSQHCPARNRYCRNCGKKGHFDVVCRSNKTRPPKPPPSFGNDATLSSLKFADGTDLVATVGAGLPRLKAAISHASRHQPHVFEVIADTGAEVTVAGRCHLQQLGLTIKQLTRPRRRLQHAGGGGMQVLGTMRALIYVQDRQTVETIYIVSGVSDIFLSLNACKRLELVHSGFPNPKVNSISSSAKPSDSDHDQPRHLPARPEKLPFPATEENVERLEAWLKEQFSDTTLNTTAKPLPVMSGPPHHIHLQKDVKPFAAHTPIPVPHHWKKEVKKQLDEDVAMGILKPVPTGEPTEWCFRMVTVPKKSGKPRRTVDFQPGNKACLRETHHTPTPFDMVSNVPPRSFKTVLDAFNGYHQVALDEESQKLTTFITEYGRYQYLRTPQGHCSAGDAYTKRYDDIVAGVPRMCKCIDDTLLYDSSIEEAFYHAFDYLHLCGQNGITLNPDKFKFCRREVEFTGYHLGWDGYKPTEDKLSAIRNFPMPEQPTISDIRSWFGLVNQMAPFLAVSPLMQPFRDLLKPTATKKVYWDEHLQGLFNQVRDTICSMAADGLAYFDKSRRTAVLTDWSRTGIGFVVLQQHCTCKSDNIPFCCKGGWRLALCGSRNLSAAESNYSAVEGEALAVVWCLKKARIFLLGNPDFIVIVDHRPLVKIFGDRALGEISNPRLLRMKEKTMQYRFTIKHMAGKKNHAADTLSRYPVGAASPDTDDEEDADALTVAGIIVAALTADADDVIATDIQHVRSAAASDDQYSKLLTKVSTNGFAGSRAQEESAVRDFYNVRDRLCIVDGLLMYGFEERDLRLVIPRSLRQQVLRNLHAAHQGTTSMLSRARQSVYWPGMDQAIQEHTARCDLCQQNAPSQQREPLITSPPPEFPFQQVVTDLFELNGHTYLSYADRLTGWLEISHLRSASSESICNVMRNMFHRWGAPQELSSDGGPNLASKGFQDFLRRWGVVWRVSTAYYPQSNGRAEAAVKTAKRLIQANTGRCGDLNTDAVTQALLMYRNTPIRDVGRSPAQLALGRQLRDGIPLPKHRYRLNIQWCRDIRHRELAMVTGAEKDKERFDRGTKELRELSVGDRVLCQNVRTKRWDRAGVIVEKLPFRSYTVKMAGSGRTTLRNRKHLKPAV